MARNALESGKRLHRAERIPHDLQRFLAGEVDVWNGYTINEPHVAEKSGVPVEIIKPSEYGVDMYADCIIATERTIKERPEVGKAFEEEGKRVGVPASELFTIAMGEGLGFLVVRVV